MVPKIFSFYKGIQIIQRQDFVYQARYVSLSIQYVFYINANSPNHRIWRNLMVMRKALDPYIIYGIQRYGNRIIYV